MIQDEDQSSDRFIICQIIKNGKQMFDRSLSDVAIKKYDKKRKQKDQNINTKYQYSIFNLIKIKKTKLSSNQLLAHELMKTNFFNKQNQDDDINENYKYYDDFQKSQQLNKKFLKRFIKPVRNQFQNLIKQKPKVPPLQLFQQQCQTLLKKQTEIELNKMFQKHQIRHKLQTKKQMIESINNKMVYFGSSVLSYFQKIEQKKKINQFKHQSIKNACHTVKQILNSQGISNKAYNYQKQLNTFAQLIESALPFYLQRAEQQAYCPLPWKTNNLQKQLLKNQFSKITGKVLYQYEHNLIEIKDKKMKMRMFEFQKKQFGEIKHYIDEKINEKNRLEEVQIIDNNSWRNLNNDIIKQRQRQIQTNNNFMEKSYLKNNKQFTHENKVIDQNKNILNKLAKNGSKQKNYVSQNLIFNKVNIQKQKITNIPIYQSFHQQQNQFLFKNNPSNGYNSRSIQNFITIRNKVPQSGQNYNQKLNLDQYKFSKQNQIPQNQNQFIKQDRKKNSSTPRNIFFNNQQTQQQSVYGTRSSKSLIQVQVSRPIARYQTVQEQSFSDDSDYFNTMNQYKQGKTTKKKKSFIKKTPPQSSSFGQIKIKQSRNFAFSKRNPHINFYPIKVGNVILQKRNYAYIEYNSAKQELKNLTVKFLIDRSKHDVNNVQVIVPSLGYKNQNKMKVNDQQKAKQIIKIILSLGGNVTKIKAESACSNEMSINENNKKQLRPKISSQLQIYRYFYKDLSYFEIIDALNMQKQWLQNERDNQKVGGWKY